VRPLVPGSSGLSQRVSQRGDDRPGRWMITGEPAHVSPPDHAARIYDRDPTQQQGMPCVLVCRNPSRKARRPAGHDLGVNVAQAPLRDPRSAYEAADGSVTISQSGTWESLKCRAEARSPFPMNTSLAPAAPISFLMRHNCAACCLQNIQP